MVRETLLPDRTPEEISAAQGSRTWKLDLENGRLLHETDGIEAVRQAVAVMLSVPRYEYLIFSDRFGHELDSLVGKDPDYIEAAAPALIKEALSPDDRIEGIEDLTFETDGDAACIGFTVRANEAFDMTVGLKGGN